MPFEKKDGEYVSPSGRKFTKKQVIAYYATDWFKKRMMKNRKKKHHPKREEFWPENQ